MISATHTTPVNVYIVELLFPIGQSIFHIPSMQVMEFATPSGPFQMLLGEISSVKDTLECHSTDTSHSAFKNSFTRWGSFGVRQAPISRVTARAGARAGRSNSSRRYGCSVSGSQSVGSLKSLSPATEERRVHARSGS